MTLQTLTFDILDRDTIDESTEVSDRCRQEACLMHRFNSSRYIEQVFLIHGTSKVLVVGVRTGAYNLYRCRFSNRHLCG